MSITAETPANSHAPHNTADAGQLVLVFQGGGALGAYQAGVYQAIHEAGLEPDWIIGTSIGAINASLIAGNERGDRIAALKEFWNRVTHHQPWHFWPTHAPFAQALSYWSILSGGLPRFFEPNPQAFMGPHTRLGAEEAAYYSTAPLTKTLKKLVDFTLVNEKGPRLTVGAAHVRTSQMRYFDSRKETIDLRHVMASGALPPAFPAVRIDDDLYWDGGILSNTPTEIVFEDNPRKNSLILAVHMWNPMGQEPETIWQVMHRQKDIQYSSRVASHIMRQKQTHRLRHIIKELAALVPAGHRDSEVYKEMVGWGCQTRMHVVRLLAPSLDHEDQTKDVDFSAEGIRRRWRAGYEQAQEALSRAPWRSEFDPLEGVILHEPPFIGEVAAPTGMQNPAGFTSAPANQPASAYVASAAE
jgi:NTE family protein